MLQIDPKKGTARTVGRSMQEAFPEMKSALPYAWSGTVATADGCIYGIPGMVATVWRFDPRTKELSTFGEVHETPGFNFFGGILGPNGRYIFCPPADAARVLCIDTQTLTCESIGEDLGDTTWKWYGGGLAGDGAIYCLPFTEDRVLRIDPVTKTTSMFGPSLGNDKREIMWLGGCTGADGCVYGTPHHADRVLRIDPFAGTVSLVGAPIPNEFKLTFSNGNLDQNGDIWCLPVHLPSRVLKISVPTVPPPLAPLRALVTNPHAFQRCLHVDSLRDAFVPMLLQHRFSTAKSAQSSQKTPPSEVSSSKNCSLSQLRPPKWMPPCLANSIMKLRPEIIAALRIIRVLPLSVAMERGAEFVSHFAVSSALRLAPDPHKWCPLPSSVDDWLWPPAPLAPLRAACKLVEASGPEGVEAAWPALSHAISGLLMAMVDAVQADLPRATKFLTEVFEHERDRSLETYRKQLRRARRDPTYPEFKSVAGRLFSKCAERKREEHRLQTISSFPRLYATGYKLRSRFNAFIQELSRHCANATALSAPLKGCGRAIEKLMFSPGVPAKVKEEGEAALDARSVVDVLRGSLRCPDFTEITFVLELLLQLDVEMGEPEKAKASGIDLDKFQIFLIRIKDRFTEPTSGGWADCMINFRFAHGDDTRHVMEMQLQHDQMLVVRKEGKAHRQYDSFRSAFEMLEMVEKAPHAGFDETEEDQSPIERMQQQLKGLQSQFAEYQVANRSLSSTLKASNNKLAEVLSRIKNVERRRQHTVQP